MSTSLASITVQTAPRDPAALEKLGIFQIRLLVEKLGALGTEQEKIAFAKLDTPGKVNLAVQLLNQFDKANGGVVHTNGISAGAVAMPAPQPIMQVPSMEVNPAALAAAAQATAPQASVRRSPRTQTDVAPPAPADLGVDVLNMLNRIIQQNDETNSMLAGALKEVLGEIKEVAKSNQQLSQNYSAVYGALQNIDRTMGAIARQSTLSMALILPLAEQVLGGSREDVLGATLGDVDSIQALLNQVANPGKAG
jgi:hypothetical protein